MLSHTGLEKTPPLKMRHRNALLRSLRGKLKIEVRRRRVHGENKFLYAYGQHRSLAIIEATVRNSVVNLVIQNY